MSVVLNGVRVGRVKRRACLALRTMSRAMPRRRVWARAGFCRTCSHIIARRSKTFSTQLQASAAEWLEERWFGVRYQQEPLRATSHRTPHRKIASHVAWHVARHDDIIS